MKIGFIGLGNMAGAMIGGMLGKNIAKPQDIIGSDKSEETVITAKEKFLIETRHSNRLVAAEAEVIVLAVKPIFMEEVIAAIRDEVTEEKIILSIAAGKTIPWLEEKFGKKSKIVRCMPNTPALVGEGCTGICGNGLIKKEEMSYCISLLESFGKAIAVPERLMDAVGAVSGSSPAYVFLFIEAMADGAVAAGMPRAQAYEFAAQAVYGSAKMVLETGKHPGVLKDMVCSPGGTTIEAVKVLEEKGFRSAVMKAMDACVEKTKLL